MLTAEFFFFWKIEISCAHLDISTLQEVRTLMFFPVWSYESSLFLGLAHADQGSILMTLCIEWTKTVQNCAYLMVQWVRIALYTCWSCSAGPRLCSDNFGVGMYENWTRNRAYLNGSVRTYLCFFSWSFSAGPRLFSDDLGSPCTITGPEIVPISTVQEVRISVVFLGLAHDDQCFCWYLHLAYLRKCFQILLIWPTNHPISRYASVFSALGLAHGDHGFYLLFLALKNRKLIQNLSCINASGSTYPYVFHLVLLTQTKTVCWWFLALNGSKSRVSARFSPYVSRCLSPWSCSRGPESILILASRHIFETAIQSYLSGPQINQSDRMYPNFPLLVLLSKTVPICWWFAFGHVPKFNPESTAFRRFSAYVSLLYSWSFSRRPVF